MWAVVRPPTEGLLSKLVNKTKIPQTNGKAFVSWTAKVSIVNATFVKTRLRNRSAKNW